MSKFNRGDQIKHINGGIYGTIKSALYVNKHGINCYLVEWEDYNGEHSHTQEFVERFYEHA